MATLIRFAKGQTISSADANANFTALNNELSAHAQQINSKASITELTNSISEICPIGTILWYAAVTAPTGFLVCNGAAIQRSQFYQLFAKIGTTFGAGDESLTFNLPNLTNGHFPRGATTVGTYANSNIAAHSHTISHTHTRGTMNITGGFTGGKQGDQAGAFSAGGEYGNNKADGSDWFFQRYYTFNASRSWTGSTSEPSNANSGSIGSGSDTYPKYLTLLPCIKY